MNPDMRVRPYKVAPETEDVFGDEFFGGLDGTVPHLIMSRRASTWVPYYGKPMLESGTLGTKGNTQLVLPRMTENYGASRDPRSPYRSAPQELSIPDRAHNQWARDFFEGTFSQAALDVNSYLSDFVAGAARLAAEYQD